MILITKKGLEQLRNHLIEIEKSIEINKIDLERARGYGDFKENAEYSIAKEQKKNLSLKKMELEQLLAQIIIFDISNSNVDCNSVGFGAEVVIENEDEKQFVYKIVSSYESDLKNNKISIDSPLVKAMLKKKIGEYFSVSTPLGEKEYNILKIDYSWLK